MTLSEQAILYYADHPAEFVVDIIGATPDPGQADILNSVAQNQMTTVRSGHGVGKSTVEAWTIIWFMMTRPFPKIPCTAPTQHQLFDILWAEISKWLRNNPDLAGELIWTKEKVYMKGYPEEWFAVARTASKPDALQGFHAEDVLYIIDEASGVDDKIFEPVLGSLSTPGSKLLMCGNPTQLKGFFFESHNKNRGNYAAFHIDGRESPRVSPDFIQTIISMYGEDSNVFRVRVSGDFPLEEDDIFIPLPIIDACSKRLYDLPEGKGMPFIILGVDVARFGDDETIIYLNDRGRCRIACHRRGQDLMKTTGDIVATYKMILKNIPDYTGKIFINIDDTGLGGGVTDRLKEVKTEQNLRRMVIVPVNAAEKIETDTLAGKKSAEWYNNLTTDMWASMRDLFTNKDIVLEDDEETAAQLSGRKYLMASNGKLQLESKKDMKKRGLPSPDRADALALALYLGKIRKYTMSPMGEGSLYKESYWNRT